MRPALLALLLVLHAAAQPLPFNVYRPQAKGAPYPAVILVHGGDFTSGTRQSPSTLHMARLFTQAGLLVFSIDYRLAPAAPFPAAVDDVRAMAQWLRAHAQKQSADPHRIVLLGEGAGAYLVNMAIARGAPASAAISIAGWSDFRNQTISPTLASFLGTTPLEDASPAMHLTGTEPPFLLIHGDRDETVPLSQSLHLQSALQSAHVPCSLLIIEGGGHDPLTWETLPTPRPWEREMLQWLQRVFPRK
ncbi:MAG: alpha/beta hydrolase [Acidobacteriota bacterium]